MRGLQEVRDKCNWLLQHIKDNASVLSSHAGSLSGSKVSTSRHASASALGSKLGGPAAAAAAAAAGSKVSQHSRRSVVDSKLYPPTAEEVAAAASSALHADGILSDSGDGSSYGGDSFFSGSGDEEEEEALRNLFRAGYKSPRGHGSDDLSGSDLSPGTDALGGFTSGSESDYSVHDRSLRGSKASSKATKTSKAAPAPSASASASGSGTATATAAATPSASTGRPSVLTSLGSAAPPLVPKDPSDRTTERGSVLFGGRAEDLPNPSRVKAKVAASHTSGSGSARAPPSANSFTDSVAGASRVVPLSAGSAAAHRSSHVSVPLPAPGSVAGSVAASVAASAAGSRSSHRA